MSQEPGPNTVNDWRRWWPWAAAVLWLVVILVGMFAFGGFRGLFTDRAATQTARASIATEEAESTRIVLQAEVADAVIRTLTAQPTASPPAAPTDTPPATPTPEPTHTPAPDLTATQAAAQNAVLTAIAATQAALPTATLTPTPLVAATETAAAAQVAAALAATLTAQPTATPSPLPALSWPVVMADPFSADENGWPTGAYQTVSGSVQRDVTDSVYRWTVQAAQGMFVTANPSLPLLDDFYIAVEGERLSGPQSTEYGLVFRQTDEDNFYSFGVSDEGQFGVFAMANGEWKHLQDWTQSTAIATGKVNRLAVWGQGTHFVCFVNDTAVATFDDDRFAAGEVGLLVETGLGTEAVVVFDTFELRAPELPQPVVPSAATTRSATAVQPDETRCVHTPTEQVPAGMALLVCDSFSSSWNVTDSDRDNVSERRTVENGRYRWAVTTEHGAFSQASPSIGAVEDFYLTAEAQQLSGAADAEYGLLFRKVSDDDLYLFSISGGRFGVFALRNGEWSTMEDWTDSPAIRPAAVNRLTIRVRGTRTAFFINEQRVAETSAIVPVRGDVGLATELEAGTEAVFEFDNFELRTPAEERPLIAAGYETDAAACAYESVLAPSGWPVVFCNSFTSDLTLNRLDWPLGDSTNDFASSQRRIAYGKYIWDVESFTGVFSPAISNLPAVSDFYMTVVGKLRKGPKAASYGVVFRRVDAENFYFFEISDNGYYQFSAQEDGAWKTLIPWTSSAAIATNKQENRIAILAEGNKFQFSINDEPVGDSTDGRFQSGGLGLAVELFDEGDKGTFEWDDLELYVRAQG